MAIMIEMVDVVGSIMSPSEDVHIFMLRTYENITYEKEYVAWQRGLCTC